MSLNQAMTRLAHDLTVAHAARHGALARVGMNTARHLKDAREARRAMAAAHHAHIAEFKHNLHVNTAIMLGAANDQIEEYHRQRDHLSSIQRQRRRDGAETMRRAMGERLRTAAEARQGAAASWRGESVARCCAMQQEAKRRKERTQAMMHGLHDDRSRAGETWRMAANRKTVGAA